METSNGIKSIALHGSTERAMGRMSQVRHKVKSSQVRKRVVAEKRAAIEEYFAMQADTDERKRVTKERHDLARHIARCKGRKR